LDVEIVTDNPSLYLYNLDWISEISLPILALPQDLTVAGGQVRTSLFDEWFEVDFIILSLAQLVQFETDNPPNELLYNLRKGIRVVSDKDGSVTPLLHRIARPRDNERLSGPPSKTEFAKTVNQFLYYSVWTAKKLRRGELLTARSCCDDTLKQLLLRVIEWYTHSKNGWNFDTRHDGRSLERWADPTVVNSLRGTFAHYDREDVVASLSNTMKLFRALTLDLSNQLGYDYPLETDQRLSAWIMARLNSDKREQIAVGSMNLITITGCVR
jgi:aminoglycoside 6-adenylyltransferase